MDSITFKPLSDTGLVRDNNEDSFIAQLLWDDYHVLCAAIDGVGGYDGGEVAAEIARSSIIRFLEDYPDNNLQDVIAQAVLQANNQIYEQRKQGRFPHMSCVASAAIIDTKEDKIYIAHVGDSRIYLYDKGTLTKLTHDHSLVGYREEMGELTEEEAMHHPRRNIIERCLGEEERVFGEGKFIDSAVYEIPAGGKLLFCTDGLTDLVTRAEIGEILSGSENTGDKCRQLVDRAKAHGGTDNITVVLVETHSQTVSPEEQTLSYGPGKPDSGTGINAGEIPSSRWMGWLIAALLVGMVLGFYIGHQKVRVISGEMERCADSLRSVTAVRDSVIRENDSLLLLLHPVDSLQPEDSLLPVQDHQEAYI